MIFFNVITAFAFLIPSASVAAELATAWPKNGVFHWIETADGARWGFTAVCLRLVTDHEFGRVRGPNVENLLEN